MQLVLEPVAQMVSLSSLNCEYMYVYTEPTTPKSAVDEILLAFMKNHLFVLGTEVGVLMSY